MKTLLVQPYSDTDHTAGRYKKFLSAMPPISLAYIAAALDQAGIAFSVYDDFLEGGSDTELRNTFEKTKPDIIGISCVTPNYPGVERVATLARQYNPQIKIIVGNIHADLFADHFLQKGLADVVVHGEGEVTVVELLRAIEQNKDLSHIKGISFLQENKVITNTAREMIADLDSIPFPAWQYFPMHRYSLFSFARLASPATLVLGSRGCPYKCNYCSLKIMGTNRRKRSMKNLADEFEYMHERFNMKQMAFVDPIFPIHTKEAIAFRDEIVGRGLHKKMVWTTETRVDLMKPETAAAMYEAGCRRVMFGFETGSDETLRQIEKRTNTARARQAVQVTREARMQIIGFFMLGVPGENQQTMEATVQFARSLDIDFAKFTVFVPYPGTDIYESLIKERKITNPYDWQRYTSYPTPNVPTVYTVEGLTNQDLMYFQKRAFRKFYVRPSMIFRHFVKLRTFSLGEMLTGLSLVLGLRSKPRFNLVD